MENSFFKTASFSCLKLGGTTLVGRGEDNDLLSIPNLYDGFTFKTDKVSSCRNLSITSVATKADDSEDSANKECENSNDQISTNDRQVLSNVNKNHNHSKRQNIRIEIASKDNLTIKNMKDNLLNMTCWNMHGLKEDKAEMIKNRDPYSEFGKLFLQNSIIFMSETWRDNFDQDILSWDDDFQEFPKIAVKDFKKGRSSGGNRKPLLPYCEIIVHDAYHIWCKLSKSIINSADADIFLCCVYIPPRLCAD